MVYFSLWSDQFDKMWLQDENVSSSGMEPDHPAVVAMPHGVISPEMVEDLYSDNVLKQLESTQKFRYCGSRVTKLIAWWITLRLAVFSWFRPPLTFPPLPPLLFLSPFPRFFFSVSFLLFQLFSSFYLFPTFFDGLCLNWSIYYITTILLTMLGNCYLASPTLPSTKLSRPALSRASWSSSEPQTMQCFRLVFFPCCTYMVI